MSINIPMAADNPVFGSDTRSQMIEIIRQEGQITAKRIFQKLKKQYSASKTYQSVHKLLQKMISEGIVVKNELLYAINPAWIGELKSYAEELENTNLPSARRVIGEANRGQTVHFSVFKESQMGDFLLDFIKIALMKEDFSEPFVLHLQFTWAIIHFGEKDYELLKKAILHKGMFVLSHDNYFWDKWAAKQWKHIGARIKTGQSRFATQNDTLVIGDYIINIFWDEKHLKWVRGDSKRIKDEKDLDFNLLLEMVLSAETKIDFVLRKDPAAAKKIREETIKVFKR